MISSVLRVSSDILPEMLFFFFNLLLADPQPPLGHYRWDSHSHPILITAFYYTCPEVTGSLVKFEPDTFRVISNTLTPNATLLKY